MALHLIPEGDGTEHTPAYSCPCVPRRDVVEHEGAIRWAVLHHTSDVTQRHTPGG